MENQFFEKPILNSPYEYPASPAWSPAVAGRLPNITNVWQMQNDFGKKVEAAFRTLVDKVIQGEKV